MDPKDTQKDKTEIENIIPPTGSSENPSLIKRKKIAVIRYKNKVLRIDKDRIVFGSIESADVKLTGGDISPIHAVLEFTENPLSESPIATIYDLASQSGVFINGEKRVTSSLFQNTQIQVGSALIDLSFEDRNTVTPKLQFDEIMGQKLFVGKEEELKYYLYDPGLQFESIFDYRPSENKKAVEVVMSLGPKVFAFEHFVDQKKITLGNALVEDFPAPAGFSESSFLFIEPSGTQAIIHLNSQMKGVVHHNGEMRRIEDIVSSSGSSKAQFQLGQKDFVKIQIGELDFYISFTVAPPRLKTKSQFRRDLVLWRFILLGLLFGGLGILGLLQIKISPSIQAEKLPERVATILYQPEKFPPIVKKVPPPVPVKEDKAVVQKPEPKDVKPKVTKVDLEKNRVKPAEKIPEKLKTGPQIAKNSKSSKSSVAQNKKQQGQNQAREGEGARAKGTEGRRGSKTSNNRSAEAQNSATRPSPESGKGKGGGSSQVAGPGNIDALKGATSEIKNLLSGTTEKLGKGGGEKFEGFGGFTTNGGGGLALSGKGQGGGGSADTLGGGLSNKGIGGGKVGTGLGAAGRGSGIVGGKTRVAIRSGGAEEGVVMGAIDASAIEAALLAHKDEFKLCYEREINAQNPNISGRVSTLFMIGPSGRVSTAGVSSSTLGNKTAELCILAVIKRIQFPIPEGGGVVQVKYPFKFAPAGGG